MSCRARKAAGSQLWKHMKCRLASTWLAVFLPALPVQLASAVLNLWLQVKLSAFCWITEGSWRLGEKKKRCFFFHFEEFPWLNQKKSYNVPKSSKDEGKQLQPIQAPSEQTPLKSLQEWKLSKSATKPLSLSFSGEGVEKQSTCSAKTPFVLSTLMFWISYWCRGCWCSSSPGRRIVPLTFDATAIEQGGRRILQKRLQKIVPQDSQTEWRPITSKATTVFDSMNHGGDSHTPLRQTVSLSGHWNWLRRGKGIRFERGSLSSPVLSRQPVRGVIPSQRQTLLFSIKCSPWFKSWSENGSPRVTATYSSLLWFVS